MARFATEKPPPTACHEFHNGKLHGGNMAEIKLSQGKVAIVDDCDFERLNGWNWYLNSYGYAVRHEVVSIARKRPSVLMHRVIADTPPGMHTDHINGNKLDNRRCNLRICTAAQNISNTGLRSDNSSGCKGVYWRKSISKWCVQISVKGKRLHVGYFSCIEAARKAYAEAADKFHGEFARY